MLTNNQFCGSIWIQEVINMTKIGENIRRRRIELKMTQEELAVLVGYTSKSTINKIEQGVNDIQQSKIMKFAEALHTSPAVLMGWVDEETGKKNDARASIAFQSSYDKELFDMIEKLSKLTPEKRQVVKTVLDAVSTSEK